MKKNVTRFLFVLIMCFTFFKVFSQDSVIFFDFYDFENCNQWQYSNILKITKNKYGNRNVRVRSYHLKKCKKVKKNIFKNHKKNKNLLFNSKYNPLNYNLNEICKEN